MPQSDSVPRHTAIIMDGNGRWAKLRGLPRHLGHCAGARSLRRVVEAAPGLGIRVLTLYAFSADNWKRPKDDVANLMDLLAHQLREEAERGVEHGVSVSLIGRRDRLPSEVLKAATYAEDATRAGARLDLRLAVDYSGRDSISGTAARLTNPTRESMAQCFGTDVDLLIRTGGEQRLSDFLLWECAYAELYFTPTLWPDFGANALTAAVRTFQLRERRFGAIGSPTLAQSTLAQSMVHDGERAVHQLRRDRWLR